MKDIVTIIFGDSIAYGLHPNSIGHEKINEEVFEVIK